MDNVRFKIVACSALKSLFWIITGLPGKPSHKFGFRSAVAKNSLLGKGRHEGLVPRNDVLTNGFV